VIEELGILQPGAPLTDQEVEDYFAYFYKLVREPGVHVVSHDYAAGMVKQFFDVSSSVSRVPKFSNLTREWVILQRINLGLYALLARLDASLDWRGISEQLWSFTDGDAVTELGRQEAAWLATLKQ
jgi:hypothetical protein